MTDYPYCDNCWWAIERIGLTWRHITAREEVDPDSWMCDDPEPDVAAPARTTS